MLAVGSVAPRFTARNQDGQWIRSEEYLGVKNIVIYFFPKDGTPG